MVQNRDGIVVVTLENKKLTFTEDELEIEDLTPRAESRSTAISLKGFAKEVLSRWEKVLAKGLEEFPVELDKRPIAYDPDEEVRFRRVGRFLVKYDPRRGPGRYKRAKELEFPTVQVSRPFNPEGFHFGKVGPEEHLG